MYIDNGTIKWYNLSVELAMLYKFAYKSLKSGDRLPPVRTVAKEIGVNPNTVAKAYRTLEIDGYIYSTVGRGTFMTDKLTKDTAYRDMALKAFREATKNAELYSVPRQQLIDIIDAIYEGGGKND